MMKEFDEFSQPPFPEDDFIKEYPSVLIRIKAMIVDSGILLLFMILLTAVFSSFERVPDSIRLLSFLFIFFLYDPLFTSLFGGTLGHMAMGIRVKRKSNEKRNLNFPFALIRFFFKAMLGWISLLTVSSKSAAIHDHLAKSVVIFQKK